MIVDALNIKCCIVKIFTLNFNKRKSSASTLKQNSSLVKNMEITPCSPTENKLPD